MYDWSILIIARNEAEVIGECIDSAYRAAGNRSVQLTVIVNGSTDRTKEIAAQTLTSKGGRLFEIAFADKSNAWNEYVYNLAPNAALHFFIDGYAKVEDRSLQILERAFLEKPRIHAATAVPSVGRSAPMIARALQQHGGLHGSLHAIRSSFLERLKERQIRLPVGLYRGDGLIGSFVMHDLAPLRTPWSPDFIGVCPQATWRTEPLSPFRRKDLHRQFNRMVQQARGVMENQAIKDIIYEGGYEKLPQYADVMLADWVKSCLARGDARLKRNIFTYLARRRLQQARTPDLPARRAIQVPLISV